LVLIFVINLHELLVELSLILWRLKCWVVTVLIHLMQQVESLLLKDLLLLQLVVVADQVELGMLGVEPVLAMDWARAVRRVPGDVRRGVLIHEAELLLLLN
jgi:hypothetical protein